MNKKKLISIVASIVVVLALAGVGTWMLLQRSTEETGGNKLGVEWYDVNGKEFVITTADELYELSELSNYYDFKDQTIKLGADIVVNEGSANDWEKKAPSRKWAPISGFGGTFDGQGHTISGLYAKGYDAAIALFSNTMSGATVQNFKLLNSYFESAGFGGVASISSNGGGKFKQIYSDAIINVVGTYSGFAGGICSKLSLQSTLEECWFDGVISTTGRDAGGILDDVLGSRVTISHCLFSGEINSTWDFSGSRTGGIVGRIAEEGAGLVLTDCLSTGVINAATIYYTGSVIGTTTANTSLTTTNSYGSMGSYDVAIGRSGLSGTINSYPIELYARELVGSKAYQWTNLDFNKYWAIVEDDTPILQCFAEKTPSVAGLEKAFDTSWYTEGASEYVITDRADLYGLYMVSASNTFSGKTIKLGADIVINEGNAKDWAKLEPENVWYPIMKFAGTFDGQGHTISGLYLSTAAEKAGFFKETVATAVVKNMSLKNSYMISTTTANAFLGSICGRGGGTFDTIYSDAIMVSHGSIVGGIFAQVNAEAKNSFTNCWFDGAITMKGETARYVGGVVGGVVKGNTTIAHCLNTGGISQLDFKDAGMFVGGIVGYIINDKTIGTISDCLNTGKISVNYHVCVGSVVGRLNQAAVTISDTYATNESYTYEDGKFRGIGTSSKGYTGGVINFPERYLTGMGGYQWSTLNFKDYWTVVTGPDSTPILKTFANRVPSVVGVARKIDTSWYSVDKKSFVLKDLEDLYGFYAVSGFDTFYEDTVKLGADIIVNEGNAADWSQVAPLNPWFTIHNFKGTFDGQGHTISGVYLKTDETYSGLFSKTTKESTVKNLKLTNSYFENTIADEMAAFGSVAGQMGGVIDSVYSDAIVVGKGTQIGGLAGRINHGALEKYTMTNCWFNGSVNVHNTTATTAYIGGLSGGLIQGYFDMNNCLNSGTVTYTFDKLPLQKDGSTHYIGTHVGGLLGGVMNGTAYNKDKTLKRVSEWNVTDCLNSGLISAGMTDGSEMNGETFANGAGSILGYTTAGTVNLKNVYATTESCTKRTMSKGKKAVVSGSVMKVSEDTISGIKGYQLTDLDFNKYWTAIVNPDETPVLKSFATGANLDGVKKLVDFTWYNPDAKSYTLDSMEDLYGFAMISILDNFNNKTVKLGADITVNEGTASAWATSAPANEWVPINSFAGTFDGNGKTISGLYLKTEDSYAGLFSKTTNTSSIKNLSITNSYFESSNTEVAALGSVAGQMGGVLDTVYSDAIVVGTGTQIGGLVGRANQSKDMEYKITNCWFDGKVSVTNNEAQLAYVGGIVGTSVQGTLNMDNCLNTGDISYTYDQMPEGKARTGVAVGGLVGGVMNGVRKDTKKGTPSVLNVSDSLNAGYIYAQTSAGLDHPYNDGVRSIVGFTTDGTVTITSDVYATKESAIGIINYNNDRATVENKATLLSESIVLGTKGYSYTLLDFDKYWSARSEQIPALKSFVGKGLDCSKVWKIDTEFDGKGTKLRPYIISSVGELYGLVHLVNNGNDFAEQYIKVANDININKDWKVNNGAPEYIWTPIGTSKNPFMGTFDGNSKTISGIYVVGDDADVYAGLFGVIADATIKEFTLTNSMFTGTASAMGTIVGNGDGTLLDIHCDNSVLIETSSALVGGMVGRVQDPLQTSDENRIANTLLTVNNCWFEGSVKQNNSKDSTTISGGIVGFLIHGTANIDNCLFTGEMNCAKHVGTTKDLYVGGVLGKANGKSNTQYSIKSTLSAGSEIKATVTGCSKYVGAITGQAQGNDTFENVYATSECANLAIGTGTNQSGAIKMLAQENFMGIKGYQMTVLDFEKYWSARTSKVPALKTFVGAGITIPKDTWRFDDSWYSDEKTEFELETEGQLFGFASLVNGGKNFKDKTVSLKKDIVIADYAWTPIGTSATNAFQGTFDGKGKTISGIHVTINDSKNYIGLFGWIADATIQNFTLSDSTFTGTAMAMGAIVGNGDGTLLNIYCDNSVTIESASTTTVGGIFGRVQDPLQTTNADRIKNTLLTVSNCWFEGNVKQTISSDSTTIAGGIVGFLIHGTVNIDNCLFTGALDCEKNTGSSKDLYVGGIFGKANGASSTSYSIKNSLSAGREIKATVNACDKYVGTTTGQAQGNDIFENVYATTECAAQSIGTGTNQSAPITMMAEENFVGIKGYQMTMLNFEEYWSARTDKVPALKTFVGNGMIIPAGTWRFDDSWYNESQTTFELQTEGQLYGFASIVNNGETFEGKTVTLKKDMIIVNSDWVPIGTSADNSFRGTFDGSGKTISGIRVTLNDSKNYIGLFGWIADATIKNFTLSESTFTGTAMAMGAIVGNGDGTLSNVRCDSTVQLSTTSTTVVGGMVGRVQDPLQTNDTDRVANTLLTITNCWFEGSIEQTIGANSTTIAGGIVGFLIHGTANVDNCLFTGNMDCKKTTGTSKYIYVGGILGKANGTSTTNYSVENSLSAGSEINASVVSGGKKYVGAITGQAQGNETFAKVYATSECAALAAGELKGAAIQPTTPVVESTLYGNLGVDNTELDFATYWVTRSGKVPALKYFAERSAISNDMMWLYISSGSESDPYMLSNESEFTKFATLVNSNGYSFKDKNLKLNNNITVTASKWQPIGVEANPFQGTFDGNDKKISGIQVTSDYKYKGLFGWTADATIKNFTLSNSKFTGKGTAIAAIVGNGDGTLLNIYCDSSVLIETTAITVVGGIVGRVQDPLQKNDTDRIANTLLTVSDCWFEGTINHTINANSTTISGGIVGYLIHGTVNIDNCLFTGSMDCEKTTGTSKYLYVGGILGKANGTTTTNYSIKNSLSAGSEIKASVVSGGKKYVGAITGQAQGNETFENVYATSECSAQAAGQLSGGAVQPTTPVASSTLYGLLGDTNTELDFTNHWIIRNGKVPALRYFVKE